MDIAAYKLWYEYLKETDPDTWSDDVRKDFGGVLTAGSFNDWYAEVWFDLFFTMGPEGMTQPMEDFSVREFVGLEPEGYKRTVLGASYRARAVVYEESPTHTVLVLNLSYPKTTLMEEVGRYIDDAIDNRKKGRPAERTSFAKYPLACRPDVSSLGIALEAYLLRKANPDWPVWKIGNTLAANFPILQKQRMKEGDIDSVSKQKVLDTVTRRYLKTADSVMAGVVVGVFPNM